jgi:geranylgeranyl reductase family protein
LRTRYDTIVVGAGPAGTTLAYELARKGFAVLVLEKKAFPRYKCCAGGITVKAVDLLGLDLEDVVEDSISGALMTFAGSGGFQGRCEQVIIHTVMRDRFDHRLLLRAGKAGADVLEGVEARGVQFDAAGVEVSTSAGSFRASFVVGADGARSNVARAMGAADAGDYSLAIETEVLAPEAALARWRGRIAMDIGQIRGGFAWLFPKADHLSIGVTCPADRALSLKRYYREFLHSLSLDGCRIARWAGGVIPTCHGETMVARGRAAVIGDAARLVDPLTREGIYNAVLSAHLAAAAIEGSLQRGEAGLEDYRHAVEEKIFPEMRIAGVFARVLTRLPQSLFRLLKQDTRIWRACCHLARGETDYAAIKEGISGLGGLYNLALRGLEYLAAR